MSYRSEIIRVIQEYFGSSKKITELNDATTPLSGTELIEIVQGGENRKVSASNFASGGTGIGYTTVDSTGGTITLAFASNFIMGFKANPSLSTPKIISITGGGSQMKFDFVFHIADVAAVISWPSSVKMPDDPRFNTSNKQWQPDIEGLFLARGFFDAHASQWFIEIGTIFD